MTSEVRTKESAKDDRPSAQAVGYLGIAMLGLVGGIIVAMDFSYIIAVSNLELWYILRL